MEHRRTMIIRKVTLKLRKAMRGEGRPKRTARRMVIRAADPRRTNKLPKKYNKLI